MIVYEFRFGLLETGGITASEARVFIGLNCGFVLADSPGKIKFWETCLAGSFVCEVRKPSRGSFVCSSGAGRFLEVAGLLAWGSSASVQRLPGFGLSSAMAGWVLLPPPVAGQSRPFVRRVF